MDCDPMDCSPPGSSIHGIFQARVLEWGAIAFSNIGKGVRINVRFKIGLLNQPRGISMFRVLGCWLLGQSTV